jgi:hypothetical protein
VENLSGLSISFTVDPGVIEHNNRNFIAKNIDRNKISDNIFYKSVPIKKFYDEVFGEALKEYNDRKKQPCRKISNYLEHITNGKQEKPFYEVIVQFGDMHTAGCGSPNGELAKQMLDEYMKNFEQRNPNLKVFNAVLHLDEATPHLHIDYVPAAKNENKSRGLLTKVSLRSALSQQGFIADIVNTKIENVGTKWIESEKKIMQSILKKHNLTKENKNVTHPHLSPDDFKKMKDAEKIIQQRKIVQQKFSPKIFSPEEIIRLKISNATQAEQLKNLEQKLSSGFVFKKFVSEEKLQHVMEFLQNQNVPFVEDGAGLHVPEWANAKITEAEKSFTPATNIVSSWRQNLKLLIDRLIYKSENFDSLLEQIKQCGYEVNSKNRKYISVKPSEGNFRAVRLKTLGDEYTEENLKKRIANKDVFLHKTNERLQISENSQLQKDYTVFCRTAVVMIYKFQKPAKKWNSNRCYSVENDYHVNQIAGQLNTITKHKIVSETDLQNRIEKLQSKIDEMKNKVAETSKTQVNLKDLIEKADFYFANIGKTLSGSDFQKFIAAKKLLESYKIENVSVVQKLRTSFAANEKAIPELKTQVSELSQNQNEFLQIQKTLEQLKGGSYFTNLKEAEREKKLQLKEKTVQQIAPPKQPYTKNKKATKL